MWYFSALLTQLALLCSWFVDGGLFLDFPLYGVLNLHVSQPPNMPRQGCTILIFMFKIRFVASIALLKSATSHSMVHFCYGVALFCGDCGLVNQGPLETLAL